jgi:hypothetical protein
MGGCAATARREREAKALANLARGGGRGCRRSLWMGSEHLSANRAPKTYTTRDVAPARGETRLKYPSTEGELHWWFTVAESVLGEKAMGLESGGKVVWDDQRIHDAHMGPRSFRHRQDMASVSKITPLITELSRESWAIVAVTYRPRRWSLVRPHEGARGEESPSPDALAGITRRPKGLGCLAGVCLLTRAATAAWTSRERAAKHPEREPSTVDILTLLRDEAQGQDPRRFFAPILREANTILDAALGEYDAMRTAREDATKVAREAELARLRAGEGP